MAVLTQNHHMLFKSRDSAAVLFVDDEAPVRQLFVDTYGNRGFNVLLAPNVADALKILEADAGHIGVLMTDHRMPGASGSDLLGRVAEQWPHIVRLLTTNDITRVSGALKNGTIFGYVTKPWDLEELETQLENALYAHKKRSLEIELLESKQSTLMSLAACIAHEMRTPLASIRTRTQAVARYWPTLLEAYENTAARDSSKPVIAPQQLAALQDVFADILRDIDRSNLVIDMLLKEANVKSTGKDEFAQHSITVCVSDVLARYPFDKHLGESVHLELAPDFRFFGSDVLLAYVLINLLKNAAYSIQQARKGEITISTRPGKAINSLLVTDTGLGISQDDLPRIFDYFYTTKKTGAGIGLAFCRQVMKLFDGAIRCESKAGEYTSFILEFPAAGNSKTSMAQPTHH
jgi:signal transduction histidine kinase